MTPDALRAINTARAARKAVAHIAPLSGAPGRVVARAELAGDPLEAALTPLFATGRSGRLGGLAEDGGDLFARIYRPSPRLVIVGAVHVTQTLAPMAHAAGFAVRVVDPRTAFATPERFAGIDLIAEWPDADVLSLDEETALATLTHDPKIDDPALTAGLGAGCFYIGALGSRKTHAKRLARFAETGHSAETMERIHAPIGLPIGAATPAEIAVSVLAEVIGALRKGGK